MIQRLSTCRSSLIARFRPIPSSDSEVLCLFFFGFAVVNSISGVSVAGGLLVSDSLSAGAGYMSLGSGVSVMLIVWLGLW